MLLKLSEGKVAVTLFLALTVIVACVALPVANAHDPAWTVPTWCYVSITNSVIGVNQQTTIIFWLNAIPPTAFGAYGDRWTFTIEVTKPDSSKETLGPFTSDPVGGAYAAYTPTQVGTYTIVAKFTEHKITALPAPPGGWPRGQDAYINDIYEASESDPITLTVQEEPIQAWQETPLPTQYWTRPINAANRDWYVLASNWLAGPQSWICGAAQNYGPTFSYSYGPGPESAHIMWSTPMWDGGIMDARFGDTGYQTSHYEGLLFYPPIILNGKIYYNVQSLPREGWYCLDLYTGEVEYFHNTTGAVTGVSADSSGSIAGEALSFGQIYNYASPNQHGGMPYLWSTNGPTPDTWMMFDAYSGNYMCSINNVPYWTMPSFFANYPVSQVYGKDGSILAYNIVNYGTAEESHYYLQCWNTSQAIWYKPSWSSNQYWLWRPGLNETYDGNNGYSLNASIPAVQGDILAVREDQFVIGGTSGKNNGTYVQQGNLWALSLKAGQEGTLLWNITFTPPKTIPDVANSLFGGAATLHLVDPEDGVFLFQEWLSRRWWGYSLETGQQLWESKPEPQLSYYGMFCNIYNGMLLSVGDYSGVVIAYDIKTGKVLWNYTASQEGFESPYGNYPIGIACIADGKLYLVSSEHSVTQPMWRGSYLRCVNASNGVELWKVLFWGANMESVSPNVVLADGYLVGLNLYDNQIYCLGKGPSATTISASPEVSVHGNDVLIKGMVIDECVGAQKIATNMGYTNGVPAIADESMQDWMEYLYMQQSMPTNATGVEVSLDTLDPNGNFIHIGTVTSDMSGMYKKAFAPEVPGEYTIIATFAGSESYYGSYAETAIDVQEAPPATSPPEYPQPIDNTMTIVYATIAIILSIAIVGIILLRKK